MDGLDLVRGRSRASRRSVVASGIAVVLAASLTVVVGSTGPTTGPDGNAGIVSVPGGPVGVTARGADPEAAQASVARDPLWPAAGKAVVDLAPDGSLRRADPLPLRVGAAVGSAGTVEVEVLDRAVARTAGLVGVVFRPAGSPASARTIVEINYETFRDAYGGDFGPRLSLVSVPSCLLAVRAPGADCSVRPVPATNDARAHTVKATVSAGTFALVPASSGPTGSYRATSFAPSATWQVGLQSGDFGWAYPIGVPTVPGLEPEVRLGYSSGSVDGRAASTNNQPSWVSEGFDYQTGYIERAYRGCADDGQSGVDELCWMSWNASISMPGLTDELVPDDATDTWRMADDDGWRVELLTGADNGDNDGEYWRLTSPIGTQYYFGRNQLPGWSTGAEVTGSTWTAPVYGNQAEEPCRAATFAASYCSQAYRWNLDYIVDTHGDAMAYFYTSETNYYKVASGAIVPYARGPATRRASSTGCGPRPSTPRRPPRGCCSARRTGACPVPPARPASRPVGRTCRGTGSARRPRARSPRPRSGVRNGWRPSRPRCTSTPARWSPPTAASASRPGCAWTAWPPPPRSSARTGSTTAASCCGTRRPGNAGSSSCPQWTHRARPASRSHPWPA